MTARQSEPPVSRRQLRRESQRDVLDQPRAEESSDDAVAKSTPVTKAGGRRVRWDPTASNANETPDESAIAVAPTDAGPDSSTPDSVARETSVGVDVTEVPVAEPVRTEVPEAMADGSPSSFAPEFAGDDVAPPAPVAPDSDLSANEKTMTRRELRILRARAEAAGLPAPDIMFGPNGESTVTGAIPILDGVAFGGTDTVSEVRDSESTVVETATTDSAEEAVSSEETVIPIADSAGVVTEQPPATDPNVSSDEPRRSEGEGLVEAPVIPALIEPDTGPSSTAFTGALPTVPEPAEILVDAEPATENSPVAAVEVTGVESDPDDRAEMPGTAAASDLASAPSAPGADAAPDSALPSDEATAEHAARDAVPAPGSLRPFDAMFLPQSSTGGPVVSAVGADRVENTDTPSRPFGHWSTQNVDDETTGSSMPTRDVGTGIVTTHALVLPSLPDTGEPLMSPLTSTGEVMVTGIVELPKSYGTTGAHPALFDHPDVDSLIDEADREDSDAAVAPVRATRAVSSATTTRSMVEEAPGARSRLLPIIGIVVGGLVIVAAAAAVIAAFVFDAF